jgi:hypothetical protein
MIRNLATSAKFDKAQPNEEIQNDRMYGKLKERDIAKVHLTEEIINAGLLNNHITIDGEENIGIQKVSFGGVIITTKKIGQQFCDTYNTNQINNIHNGSFAHRSLCARHDEATGLLFLTLEDLVGHEDYKILSNKEVCTLAKKNLCTIVEEKMQWVIQYSKHVVKDYYSAPFNKLKIKPNFILDDGVYDDETGAKGGLLLRGLLQELEFYKKEWAHCMGDSIGMLCQVLSPSGLPRNRKWIQIDVGISFIGKRNYMEHMKEAVVRQVRSDIKAWVHPDVIREGFVSKGLRYGVAQMSNNESTNNYDGYDIFLWEVLYHDQIKFMNNENVDCLLYTSPSPRDA